MLLSSASHDPGVTRRARQMVASEGALPSGLLPGEIEASWNRCLERGLRPDHKPDLQQMNGREFDQIRDRHRQLIASSIPEMESLCRHFGGSDTLVMLSDADATILKTLGEQRFLDRVTRYSLQAGTCWRETVGGTNAFGTVMEQGRPLLIRGGEHYLESLSGFSCSAAPIRGPGGEIAGILDVTSEECLGSRHNLGLVSMSAELIEQRLFSDRYRQQLVLAVHSRPEFIGSLWQGLLAFSDDGRLLALNRQAGELLSIASDSVGSHCFASLFGCSLSAVVDQSRRSSAAPLQLRHEGKASLTGRMLNIPLQKAAGQPAAQAQTSLSPRSGSDHSTALAGVTLDDAEFGRAAGRGRKALDHQIPILLLGETGSGKEMLARALHEESNRGDQPFVALNCAAIPEGLIESELFGYQDGAFTGARRGGMQGKVQQASRGSLFLDEIGDMPLEMQARLLRVLQERSVTPLGSNKEIPVDITVICATHRDLKQMVAEGRFREDLYYRLNGVSIRIPPLRDRANFPGLVDHLLHLESGGNAVPCIDPGLMATLQCYRWPGNVRQLQTLLKTCLAFVEEGEQVITEALLTDDFRDELTLDSRPVVPNGKPDRASRSPGTLQNAQIELIKQAIEASGGNMSAAALSLGISRATLYRRLQNAGIRVVSDKQIRDPHQASGTG